jgi:hypothetical protein
MVVSQLFLETCANMIMGTKFSIEMVSEQDSSLFVPHNICVTWDKLKRLISYCDYHNILMNTCAKESGSLCLTFKNMEGQYNEQ